MSLHFPCYDIAPKCIVSIGAILGRNGMIREHYHGLHDHQDDPYQVDLDPSGDL